MALSDYVNTLGVGRFQTAKVFLPNGSESAKKRIEQGVGRFQTAKVFLRARLPRQTR